MLTLRVSTVSGFYDSTTTRIFFEEILLGLWPNAIRVQQAIDL